MYQLISQPTHSHLSMASVSFGCQPHNETPNIEAFYHMYLKSNNLTLRPPYQRNPCWVEEQQSGLIDTIMNRCPMPPFLIYKHGDDPMECIDGQNRLGTIQKYMEQSPPTEGNPIKPFAWKIDQMDEKTGEIVKTEYVFYNETPEFKTYVDELNRKNKNKGKVYRFMTPHEQTLFNDYGLVAQMIKTYLTFDQRKAIFNKWQNGSSISQCDHLKNEDTPICKWVLSSNIERRLGDKITQLLKSGSKNWMFDVVRLLRVFVCDTHDATFSVVSTLKARTIVKSINGFDEAIYELAAQRVEQFLYSISKLAELNPKITISFLLVWAFLWIKSDASRRERMTKPEFMIPFAKSSMSNELLSHSTLNNGPQVKLFLESVSTIEKEFEEEIQKEELPQGLDPRPRYKKTPISDALKTQVWNEYLGKEVGTAKCVCCGVMEITQRDFEAGHVIAERKGGKTILDNLRPICKGCNARMTTNNMKDWMKENYPNREFK